MPFVSSSNLLQKKPLYLVVGSVLLQTVSFSLFLALLSYAKGLRDLGTLALSRLTLQTEVPDPMWVGQWGHIVASHLMVNGFGASSLFLPFLGVIVSLKLLFFRKIALLKSSGTLLFMMVWTSIALGYFFADPNKMRWYTLPGGIVSNFSVPLKEKVGLGVLLLLFFGFVGFFFLLYSLFSPKKKKEEMRQQMVSATPPTRYGHYAPMPGPQNSSYFRHAEPNDPLLNFNRNPSKELPPPDLSFSPEALLSQGRKGRPKKNKEVLKGPFADLYLSKK